MRTHFRSAREGGGLVFLLGSSVGPADTLSAGLGWEVLGGDEDEPGEAFRTPLATLHAFNGWADQFLTTPGPVWTTAI